MTSIVLSANVCKGLESWLRPIQSPTALLSGLPPFLQAKKPYHWQYKQRILLVFVARMLKPMHPARRLQPPDYRERGACADCLLLCKQLYEVGCLQLYQVVLLCVRA